MPSDLSAILALPYLMPAQAQKHVTHNEALRMLDVVVQLAVLDRDRTAPPPTPAEGDRHLVATGATGAWAGQEGTVAAFLDGGWSFFAPRPGWRAEVLAEGSAVVWDGTAWTEPVGPTQVDRLGVNTAADSVNRLAVASAATLLTHEGGGHQLKVNKATAADTASLLFQSGWTGHAEMGLAGDTDFAIKAYDGAEWYEAMKVHAENRQVSFGWSIEATAPTNTSGEVLDLTRYSGAGAPTHGANIRLRRARGTQDAPLPVLKDDVFGMIVFSGWVGSGFAKNQAAFAMKADEDWTSTAQGTRFTIELAEVGTKTRKEVMVVHGDGTATLAGKEIYSRGNLLGPVSQSGGVPVGAVIERGATGNGEYVKFADGTLICTRAMAGSATSATTWTFPAAFAAAPAVSGAVQASALSVLCLDAAPTGSAASFSLRDASGRRADTVHLTAVGRWA